MTVVFLYIQNFLICNSRISDRKRGSSMEFFTQAIETLKVLVMALGAGLGVWGIINLLEGYGNDNRATRFVQTLCCFKDSHITHNVSI